MNWKPLVYMTKKGGYENYWQFREENNFDATSIGEDSIESILGAIEVLVNKYQMGFGYPIVYNIITSILDKYPVTFNLERLEQPANKLKEIYDREEMRGDELMRYEPIYDLKQGKVTIFKPNKEKIILSLNAGEMAKTLIEKERKNLLAEKGLNALKKLGIEWRVKSD